MATCTISGTIVNLSETAISGANVRAYSTGPFISGTNYVTNSIVTTTTDTNGDWSLALTRTANLTTPRTVTIEFEYTDGRAGLVIERYTVSVPNAATANFEDLITIP